VSRLERGIEDADIRAGDADNPFEREHWLLIAGWLRELRGRRRAMGRDPDDERNAVADLACPGCGDLEGECGCVEAAEEMGAFDGRLCPGCGSVDCCCDDDAPPSGEPW
jgi:hypothetical protein